MGCGHSGGAVLVILQSMEVSVQYRHPVGRVAKDHHRTMIFVILGSVYVHT